jgi:hypothetical protein
MRLSIGSDRCHNDTRACGAWHWHQAGSVECLVFAHAIDTHRGSVQTKLTQHFSHALELLTRESKMLGMSTGHHGAR